MSYIFEYALKSSENLLNVFQLNSLTPQERQSDKIWVENKHLIVQNMHESLSVFAHYTSYDFVATWVENNFFDLFMSNISSVSTQDSSDNSAEVAVNSEENGIYELPYSTTKPGDFICETQALDFLSPEFLAKFDTSAFDESQKEGFVKIIRYKLQKLNQDVSFLRIVPIALMQKFKELDSDSLRSQLQAAYPAEFFLFITKHPQIISPAEYFKSTIDNSIIVCALDFIKKTRFVPVKVNRELNCLDVTFENKEILCSIIDKMVDWFKLYAEDEDVRDALEMLAFCVRVNDQFTFAEHETFDEFTAEKFKQNPDKYFSSLGSKIIKIVKDLVEANVFAFDDIKELNFDAKKTALHLKEEWYGYIVQTALKRSGKTGMEALEFLEQFYTPEDFGKRVQNPWIFESIEQVENIFTTADYVAWRVAYAQKGPQHEKWLETRGNFINQLEMQIKDLKQFIADLKVKFENIDIGTLISHVTKSGITLKSRFISTSLSNVSMSSPTGIAMDQLISQVKNFLHYGQQTHAVGILQKKIDEKKPLSSLQVYCMYAILGEMLISGDDQFFEKINPDANPDYNWKFKNSAIEQAWALAQAVRGGYDAQKYLDISYAMTYFASVRKGRNLFPKREPILVHTEEGTKPVKMIPITHCDGIPGMELASPFEKGFSWGNYDEISTLARVTPYVNAEVNMQYYYSSKRLAAYLLAYSTKWDAKTLQERLANTKSKSCARVVNQIANQFNGDKYEYLLKNFGVVRANRDKFVEFFEQNYDQMENIFGAMIYFIRFGKLPNSGILSTLNEMTNFMMDQNMGVDEIDSYLDYISLSTKNKVNSYYIFESIRYARGLNKPVAKAIKAQTYEDAANGVRIKLLEAGDLRALTIGAEVNCCQYYLGHASTCAEATYYHQDYSVAVVENIDSSNGTRPLAEAALWISQNTVVIDSIEGLRKDAAGYEKIAAAFSNFIDQWHEQGLKVVLSMTDYGLTNQIRRKLSANPKYRLTTTDRPDLPLRVYTDTSYHVYNIVKRT